MASRPKSQLICPTSADWSKLLQALRHRLIIAGSYDAHTRIVYQTSATVEILTTSRRTQARAKDVSCAKGNEAASLPGIPHLGLRHLTPIG
jgi:hypothetical protein